MPALLIGVVVLLGLALLGSKQPKQSKPSDAPATPKPDSGGETAGEGFDIGGAIGAAGSIAGALIPSIAALATTAGGTTATAVGSTVATGGGATAAGSIGSSAATATTGTVSTAGATGGTTAASVATVSATAAVSIAEIAVAGVWALIIIAIQVTLLVFNAERNRLSVTSGGIVGTKKRYDYEAFYSEEDIITDVMRRAGAPVHKALTYDGWTNDAGENIERFRIIALTPVYYIDRLPIAEFDGQRRIVDVAKCIALTKVQARNDYMRSLWFARMYQEIADTLPANATHEERVALVESRMMADGFALTADAFNQWRDLEYFPNHRLRAWKQNAIEITSARLDALARTVQSDTFFENQWWGECVNVTNTLQDAAVLLAKTRMVGLGEGISFGRRAFGIGINIDHEKTALVRVGYTTRDPICGWYFDNTLQLKNESGQIIQPR